MMTLVAVGIYSETFVFLSTILCLCMCLSRVINILNVFNIL